MMKAWNCRYPQMNLLLYEDRGNYSEVRELEATEKGFNVPTFKDALQDILNQTSETYSFEE